MFFFPVCLARHHHIFLVKNQAPFFKISCIPHGSFWRSNTFLISVPVTKLVRLSSTQRPSSVRLSQFSVAALVHMASTKLGEKRDRTSAYRLFRVAISVYLASLGKVNS